MGRRTGRGGLAVTAAKVYFILTGLVQQIALKGVLGLEGYGALSTALGTASIAYNPVVGASIQGVSHAVATASQAEQAAALRRTLRVHALLAGLVGSAFFLLAPTAGRVMGAPHVIAALRLLALVLLVYGLYAPLVGVLNGRTQFGSQAALDALAATLRTLGLIGGALWLGRSGLVGSGETSGVEGATLGFAISAALELVVAVARVRAGHGGARAVAAPSTVAHGSGAQSGETGRSVRDYLRYLLPILAGQVLLNLLFQADALLLRRFAADAALAAGLHATAADPLIGAYRAAQLFCFLPYQLVLSVSLVIFPVLARAHARGNRSEVALYVRQGTRLGLVVSGLLVSVTAGLPGPLLKLVFGSDAARIGADAMTLLSPGLGTLAVLGVLTAVLNGLGAPRQGLLGLGHHFVFCDVSF
jgi:stage V sporulation protein B